MPVRRLAPAIIIALALAACAGTSGTSPSAAGGSVDEETVAIGTAMAQMRGHLRVATELDAAGDDDGAAVHTSSPRPSSSTS